MSLQATSSNTAASGGSVTNNRREYQSFHLEFP